MCRGSAMVRHDQTPKAADVLGIAVHIVALALLLYLPEMNSFVAMVLCFAFGFGNAAHMLAFSTAADVVTPNRIGTSAAIVNGIMFIVGGIMISRPGMRIGGGLERDRTQIACARAVRGLASDGRDCCRIGLRSRSARNVSGATLGLSAKPQ